MLRFKVTHAQRRFDGPDDPPVETVVTVREGPYGKPGTLYLVAKGLGCSRDFAMPADTAIRRWLTGEHAQTVISIEVL